MGLTPVVAPFLEIRAVTARLPPPDKIGAILLASGNAVDQLPASLHGHPVLTVGAATARRARDAGFRDVASADGDAAALVRLVRSRFVPHSRPGHGLVEPHGRQVEAAQEHDLSNHRHGPVEPHRHQDWDPRESSIPPFRHPRARPGGRTWHESADLGGFLEEPVPLPVPGTSPGMMREERISPQSPHYPDASTARPGHDDTVTATTLLLAAGQGQSFSLAADLRASGYRVARRVVYAARPVNHLPEAARLALLSDNPLTVLFFSAETARQFVRLVHAAGLAGALQSREAITIGVEAGMALEGTSWSRIRAAGMPTQNEMLALLR